MLRPLAAASLLILAVACASTAPPPGAVAPTGAGRPAGPIDLGGYRGGSADAVSQRFAASMARRYAAGLPLSVAAADLRANQFACTRPPPAKAGDPPDQVCRRTATENGCTHTWQAHLWDDSAGASAKLTRVRGLYDKRCASDGGLLGGPGAP
jgi:hypothetical protein